MNNTMRYLFLCVIVGFFVLGPLVERFAPERRLPIGLVLSLLMAIALRHNVRRERDMEDGK